MEKQMKKKYTIVVALLAMCIASQAFANKGAILSYADSEQSQAWGLEMREMAGGLVFTIQDRIDLGRLDIDGTTSTDGIYDWGASLFNDSGTYRMWWVRQNSYDVICYADSTDGVHWTNTQQVLSAKGGSSQEQLHVGKPAVVKVGTTYYMFYESPKLFTNYPDGEYANQIFVATSTDGKNWTKYPSNDNPQPVISVPSDITEGAYGIGQPSVFYKDGQFNLSYVCNLTGWPDQIRFAKSSSPTNWGAYTTHDLICNGGAGVSITWNTALNKYVMLYVATSSVTPEPNTPDTSHVYVFTSTDGLNWQNGDGATYNQPYLWTIAKNCNKLTLSPFANPKVRGYPSFFGTDQYGIVNSSTMRISFMQGTMPASGSDWRSTSGTWDLYALSFDLNVELQTLLEIHLMGANGQVYQMGATALSSINNGAESDFDTIMPMMASGMTPPGNMRGLAIVPTYAGPYGQKYVATRDNITMDNTIWGDPSGNTPGNMIWYGPVGNAWTLYAYDTDICPSHRAYVSMFPSMDIWTVNSTQLNSPGTPVVNGVYLYSSVPWAQSSKEDWVERFIMPKELRAVALGDTEDDLWVLCLDGEVLHISALDGTIDDRFFIDSRINAPWGMAYAPASQSLWIGNTSNNYIYRVATTDEQFLPDLDDDGKVNFADFAVFASEWSLSGTRADIHYDGIVNFEDLAVLASKWLAGTD
jgi:predicted GH43/DUF377 family glycosyl hydrolase